MPGSVPCEQCRGTKMKLFPILLLVAMAVSGCASPTTQRVNVSAQQAADEAQRQLDIVAQELVSERTRLQQVHWRVATSSTLLCPRLTRLSGADVMTLPRGDIAPSMKRLFGLQTEPTVLSVIPGGPADKAGIKSRDVVQQIYGFQATDQNANAIKERAKSAKDGEALPVQVLREGQRLTLWLKPQLACDYPATLDPQQILNAYADGDRIIITRGMMAFARADEELALVIAHEMAHNAMRHIDAKKANAAAGLAADVALAILSRGAYRNASMAEAAAQAYSQEFEAEADYVGLYMLANSGYSVQEAPKFWRRMAAAHPGNIKGTHTASHPPTSYRMVALEEAAREIDLKRSTSASLVPVRRDGKPFVAGEGLFPGSGSQQGPCTAFVQDGSGQCARR